MWSVFVFLWFINFDNFLYLTPFLYYLKADNKSILSMIKLIFNTPYFIYNLFDFITKKGTLNFF